MNPQKAPNQKQGEILPASENVATPRILAVAGQIKQPCAKHKGLCIPEGYQRQLYAGTEPDYQKETEMTDAISLYRRKNGRYPPYCKRCCYFVFEVRKIS